MSNMYVVYICLNKGVFIWLVFDDFYQQLKGEIRSCVPYLNLLRHLLHSFLLPAFLVCVGVCGWSPSLFILF